MQRYSFKVDGEYRRPTPDDAGAFYDVAIVNARIAELEKALASSPCACTLEMVQAKNMMILTSRITKCPRCAALSL